jgi:methylenetetrahydrofolate reductase (NADPH)
MMTKRPSVSFEFFPPKSEEAEASLWRAINALAPLKPDFVSVTYGAGGSTRERTHATVARLAQETDLTPAAHLTCVDATRDSVIQVVRGFHAAGVKHIVALRGDPTTGLGTAYVPHPDGFQSTAELIRAIRDEGDFEISVSAYPEKHPESPSLDHDIDVLKAKIDAGATRAITQFFFDNDLYLRFVDRVRKAGIDIPIVPGIVPVQNYKQTAKFAERCGATLPAKLADRFEGLDDDPATRALVAAAVAAEQVNALAEQGVDLFHFYTMNKSDLVLAICRMIGVKPDAKAAA